MLKAWRMMVLAVGCGPLFSAVLSEITRADEPALADPPQSKIVNSATDFRPLRVLGEPVRRAELQVAEGTDQFTFLVSEAARSDTPGEPHLAEKEPAEKEPAEQEPAKQEPMSQKPAKPELQQVPASSLVEWGHPAEIRAEVMLLTAGGSLLAGSPVAFGGDIARLEGGNVTFVSALFDEVELPLKTVRAVVFQPPADARGRDQLLAKLANTQGAEDLVMLTNGDELSGSIRAMAEGKLTLLRRGAAGNSELELSLATPGGAGQVAAVAFNQPPRKQPERPRPRYLVGFEEGSLLVVKQLWRNERQARLLLAEPSQVEVLCDRPAKLISLQPLQAGITYLSDLTAHSYRHVPYLSLTRSYRADRGVTGDRLRSAGHLYNKGLGIPSAARLTYQFDKAYQRLEAELALDDAAGMKGSVLCKVYVYSDGAWKAALETPVIRGGDPPLPISVDVRGARAVTLIVDYADRGDELDLANWLNARLIE